MNQDYERVNSPQRIAVLYGCQGCGAVVYSRGTHNWWHEKMEGKAKQ